MRNDGEQQPAVGEAFPARCPTPAARKAQNAYALPWGDRPMAFFARRAAAIDLGWLQVRPGDSVLDVGCGPGDLTRRVAVLAAPGCVTGIDCAAEFVEAASDQSGLRFVRGVAESLPFAAATFDVSYCHTVLMHLADPLLALGEMARVTRPGGRMIALGEGDWSLVDARPACKALESLIALVLERMQNLGANPLLGARLDALFHAAGLVQIEVDEAPASGSSMTGPALAASGLLEFAAALLPAENAQTGLAGVRAWCANAASLLTLPRSFRARARNRA